jgi:L-threonylcarbamoyladenylate synthase
MTDPRFTTDLARAAQRIRAGELVAFPTETVYGLGADASNENAVGKIFAAKGRPADHPLIVHFDSIPAAQKWAFSWQSSENLLANAFWPGPMTLIVKRAVHVSDLVTGGQDTVGLRVPSHPTALALLRASGCAIAAPSANKFGHISPTRAAHVAEEFGGELQTILLGEDCEVGVESTIIDCTVWPVRLLRPGRISADDITRVLGTPPRGHEASAPRVSGALASHYAPRTRTLLKPKHSFSAPQVFQKVGTLTFTVTPQFAGTHFTKMKIPAAQIEHDLYANLRDLDAAGLDEIWIETPPEGGAWDAVRDRVTRASAQR